MVGLTVLIIAEEILVASEDILMSQDTVNNFTIMAGIANIIDTISQDVIPCVVSWVVENKDWLLGVFSGIGIVAVGFLYRCIKWLFSSKRMRNKLQINTNFYIAIEENTTAKILADVFARLNVNKAHNDMADNIIANLFKLLKALFILSFALK